MGSLPERPVGNEVAGLTPCGKLTKEFPRVNRALKTLGADDRTVLRATDEQTCCAL
jgi:hypothetical protein